MLEDGDVDELGDVPGHKVGEEGFVLILYGHIVKLVGDIDAASIDMFQRTVEPMCRKNNPRVYLDCAGLNYVNSSGFGLLFTLTRACAERGGEFVLCAPRTKVLNVMRVLGLEHLLNVTEEPAAEFAAKQTAQQ